MKLAETQGASCRRDRALSRGFTRSNRPTVAAVVQGLLSLLGTDVFSISSAASLHSSARLRNCFRCCSVRAFAAHRRQSRADL